MIDLEALAATVAQMTAGEWALSGKLTIRGGKCRDGSLGWVGKMIWSGAHDAAGIVALRNAAPDLIAETQAMRERVRVLEEAVQHAVYTFETSGAVAPSSMKKLRAALTGETK